MDDNDFEILDVENYKGSGEQAWSHQVNMMKVIQKCIEAGTKEMRSGYYNTKKDKLGNSILTYVPDTRKEFIESVKTAKSIIARDFDDEAKEVFKKITDGLKDKFEELCKLEEDEWQKLNVKSMAYRFQKGIFKNKGTLNMNLPYHEEYISYEVQAHRDLLEEFLKLTKRLNDYEEVGISA